MRKYIIFIIVSCLILSGCAGKPENDAATTTTKNSTQSMNTTSTITTTKTTTKVTSTTEAPTTTTAETTQQTNEALTEVLKIYGRANTNGNLNNMGLAAYDSTTKSHIYSLNDGVYSMDPGTGVTQKLFTMENGRAVYLNLSKDWIYFIDSSDGSLQRVSRNSDMTFETLVGSDCLDLRIEQSYVFYRAIEGDTTPIYSWSRPDRAPFRVNPNASNFSHNYSKLYFSIESSSGIRVRVTGTNGSGSDLFQLDGIADQILEMFAYNENEIYFLARLADKKILYLYTDGALKAIPGIDSNSMDIRNLNYDGKYFYYISSGDIVRFDKNDFKLEKVISTGIDAFNLNIVNNWIYWTDANMQLYQLKPGEDNGQILK